MISKERLAEAMYCAMRKAATCMPPDVESALEKAYAEETDPLALKNLELSLENNRLSSEGRGLVCGDTGFPLYFVTLGNNIRIDGGFNSVFEAAKEATARATAEAFLRPTMVDPLTRDNPGDNIGPGMPKVEIKFSADSDSLEIVAAPKGGGSEIFGTFYRMLFPSDGREGIMKFVVECVRKSCYAGKICPPAIIGVGIGGTADLCVKMAKEAALLRAVGSENKDPKLDDMEKTLLAASRKLGIGPLGARGINAVMAMHIATAYTHTAALPVAVNAQCLVGRRWKARIDSSGEIFYTGGIS